MLKLAFSIFESISSNYLKGCSILEICGLKKFDRIAPHPRKEKINGPYIEENPTESNSQDFSNYTESNSNNSICEPEPIKIVNIEDETLFLQRYLDHLEEKVLNSEFSTDTESDSDEIQIQNIKNKINYEERINGKLSECTYSKLNFTNSSWRQRKRNKVNNYYYIQQFNLINRIDDLKMQMQRVASAALNIYTEAQSSLCDVFISYKQNDSSDALVINMHYSMKENKLDAWLDKMRGDERSESGMVAGVKSCRLFCAVISPYYFKSKFCLLELQTAIRMSKKLVICFNGSKFKIQEALSWIPEEYLFLKNDELIKLDEDNEYMQIGLDKVIKRL
jgi:hypothetical protein